MRTVRRCPGGGHGRRVRCHVSVRDGCAASAGPCVLGPAYRFLGGPHRSRSLPGPRSAIRRLVRSPSSGATSVCSPPPVLVTGFPPGLVTGTLYVSGATDVVIAHADLVAAYADAVSRPSNFALAGDLIGLTLHPGVHANVGAVANTGTVTLDGDGDANSVFIFQVNGALAMAAGSKVILTNGTQATNVFWQVEGAGAIGAVATFAGTLMTSAAIGVGAESSFNGRALAKTGAITTNSNQFYSNPPVVTISGGPTVSVADDTPTISGSTTVDVPASVTVTVGIQTLLATVQAGGAWRCFTCDPRQRHLCGDCCRRGSRWQHRVRRSVADDRHDPAGCDHQRRRGTFDE